MLNRNEAELKKKVGNKVNVGNNDENVKMRCEALNKRLEFTHYTDGGASGDSIPQFNN